MSRIKFLAGDQESPSTFVQRLFYKLNTKDLSLNNSGRMIFCAGEQTPEEVQKHLAKQKADNVSGFSATQETERESAERAKPNQNALSAPQTAEKIYSQMQVLDGLYANLQRLSPQSNFEELRQELKIVTMAMGRITQNLSKPRKPFPPQTFPPFSNFCQGLSATIHFLGDILKNLRHLMRTINAQNTQVQLFIIYTTLSAQRQDLAQMDCK